jgi:hypothetical protein
VKHRDLQLFLEREIPVWLKQELKCRPGVVGRNVKTKGRKLDEKDNEGGDISLDTSSKVDVRSQLGDEFRETLLFHTIERLPLHLAEKLLCSVRGRGLWLSAAGELALARQRHGFSRVFPQRVDGCHQLNGLLPVRFVRMWVVHPSSQVVTKTLARNEARCEPIRNGIAQCIAGVGGQAD